MAKRKNHTPEQVVRTLRTADELAAGGTCGGFEYSVVGASQGKRGRGRPVGARNSDVVVEQGKSLPILTA